MGTTYTDYAQYGNATVYVSTSSELNSAIKQLAANGGGTIKVDPDGGPYDLSVSGVGSEKSPVLIESATGGTALFESITITRSEYIAISNVNVDTSYMTDRGAYVDDLRVENSSHIEVVDSTFKGSAVGYLSEATSGDIKGNVGAYVLDSDNILLSGNSFSNHWYAVKVTDTTDVTFTDNEVTQFQADGFHGGGLQDALIAGNWFHDPLGSTQSLAHTDFIQIRRVNTDLQNKNIEIAYNILDSEDGGGAQGIHMGTGGSSEYVDGLSIHDNLIHTSLPRGIGVDKVLNLEVYNNTVLWNEATSIQATATSDPQSWDARILISGSPDAEIYDNISSWIRVNGTQYDAGGYQIQYKDPSAANYVDKHIANLDGSGDPDSYDLSLLKSSSLFGEIGAALSWDGTLVGSWTSNDGDDEPEVVETDGTAGGTPVEADDESDAVHLYLVDSATDTVVRELSTVDEVTASEVSKGVYNLKAVYDGGAVGSVQFWSDGTLMHTENGAPYAAYSNTGADYWDEALPEDGTVRDLEVRVYSGRNGTGNVLDSREYEIGYADGEEAATSPHAASSSPEETPDDTPAVEETAPESTGGTGEGGTEPEEDDVPKPHGNAKKAAQGEDEGNVFSKFFDMIFGVFGGGSDGGSGHAAPVTARAFESMDEVVLSDVLPVTDRTEDGADEEDEDETEVTHLAA